MTKHGKRILMVVQNIYPHDIRVRKEAEALTEAGYSVSVIALKGMGQKACEEIKGVQAFRIPEVTVFEKAKRSSSSVLVAVYVKIRSIAGYVLEYVYFTLASFFVSLFIYAKDGFDVIHMHNPPDTLSLIGIFYKLLGKKYIFDHHDLSPELYLTRVSGKRDMIYRGLLFFEGLSCKFSDIIISTNESYRQMEINRYAVKPEKIFIVRNNPKVDDCIFSNREQDQGKPENQRTKLLFLGCINPQDGIEVLLQAIRHLVFTLEERNVICTIVGGGDSLESAKRLSRELGLSDYVDFTGQIFDREKVKEYLRSSDIGVEPAPCNKANEHSTFIKVMEFMAAGKPLVAFDLKETRYSAEGAALLVPPGDIEGFSRALQQLMHDPAARMNMGQTGFRRIATELNWDRASKNLENAYGSLREWGMLHERRQP
jgi:glycosyltransferase involved in cell wall biosynthesis